MLEIENACIEFNRKRLFQSLTLHIHPGEILCVTGESGSGKTSLLRSIMGFVPLKEGSIRVDGITLSAQTAEAIRRKITYIPQELALPSEWVKEMVQLPFDLKANSNSHFSKEGLFAYFRLLGLEEELYQKRVGEISGGQRQRIMIAVSALLNKPLFIIDEPTSALDPDSAHKVIAFFQELARNGQTIVAVSHDKMFAAECSRHLML